MELITNSKNDFTWVGMGELIMYKISSIDNINKLDSSLNIPEFVTREQIRKGKEITAEILCNPELERAIDRGIDELKRGKIVARKRGAK
jgi:hypothetical protein